MLHTPADAAAALAAAGADYAVPFRHGTMEVGVYRPAGTGTSAHAGERRPFGPGDVPFAAAGTPHRFVDFSPDFLTRVFFWGPPGGEVPAPPAAG